MNRPPIITKELLRLFDLLFSGQAPEETLLQSEKLFLENEEIRKAYICYCDMEAELRKTASNIVSFTSPEPAKRPISHFSIAALVAFGFFLTASVVFTTLWMQKPSDLSELDEVAIVTRLENARISGEFSDLQTGDSLRPMSRLKIREGTVQLSFFSGAKIAVQAPAEFTVDSGLKLSLLEGKVSAYVPQSARLFTIAIKKYSVIDQGTRVSVEANSNGEVQAYVHEGSVRFNYLGNDGVTSRNQILSKFEKLTVNQKSETSLETGDFSGRFPAVEFPKLTALTVPESYVEAVLRKRPVLYWRFENNFGDIIPNAVSLPGAEAFDGRVEGEMHLLGERGNRSWVQINPEAGVFVSSATAIKNINSEGYSIELWVNPMEFRRATLASLVDPQVYPASDARIYFNYHHLASLELMSVGSDYVHPANSFRFLHRWPPGTEGNIGSNIFEPGYIPGRWYHVVAVRSAVDPSGKSEQSFYLNGTLVSRKRVEEDRNDSDAYEFVVGRLDPARNERGLLGMIDEVALYSYPLSSEEIAAHYQMVRPGGN